MPEISKNMTAAELFDDDTSQTDFNKGMLIGEGWRRTYESDVKNCVTYTQPATNDNDRYVFVQADIDLDCSTERKTSAQTLWKKVRSTQFEYIEFHMSNQSFMGELRKGLEKENKLLDYWLSVTEDYGTHTIDQAVYQKLTEYFPGKEGQPSPIAPFLQLQGDGTWKIKNPIELPLSAIFQLKATLDPVRASLRTNGARFDPREVPIDARMAIMGLFRRIDFLATQIALPNSAKTTILNKLGSDANILETYFDLVTVGNFTLVLPKDSPRLPAADGKKLKNVLKNELNELMASTDTDLATRLDMFLRALPRSTAIAVGKDQLNEMNGVLSYHRIKLPPLDAPDTPDGKTLISAMSLSKALQDALTDKQHLLRKNPAFADFVTDLNALAASQTDATSAAIPFAGASISLSSTALPLLLAVTTPPKQKAEDADQPSPLQTLVDPQTGAIKDLLTLAPEERKAAAEYVIAQGDNPAATLMQRIQGAAEEAKKTNPSLELAQTDYPALEKLCSQLTILSQYNAIKTQALTDITSTLTEQTGLNDYFNRVEIRSAHDSTPYTLLVPKSTLRLPVDRALKIDHAIQLKLTEIEEDVVAQAQFNMLKTSVARAAAIPMNSAQITAFKTLTSHLPELEPKEETSPVFITEAGVTYLALTNIQRGSARTLHAFLRGLPDGKLEKTFKDNLTTIPDGLVAAVKARAQAEGTREFDWPQNKGLSWGTVEEGRDFFWGRMVKEGQAPEYAFNLLMEGAHFSGFFPEKSMAGSLFFKDETANWDSARFGVKALVWGVAGTALAYNASLHYQAFVLKDLRATRNASLTGKIIKIPLHALKRGAFTLMSPMSTFGDMVGGAVNFWGKNTILKMLSGMNKIPYLGKALRFPFGLIANIEANHTPKQALRRLSFGPLRRARALAQQPRQKQVSIETLKNLGITGESLIKSTETYIASLKTQASDWKPGRFFGKTNPFTTKIEAAEEMLTRVKGTAAMLDGKHSNSGKVNVGVLGAVATALSFVGVYAYGKQKALSAGKSEEDAKLAGFKTVEDAKGTVAQASLAVAAGLTLTNVKKFGRLATGALSSAPLVIAGSAGAESLVSALTDNTNMAQSTRTGLKLAASTAGAIGLPAAVVAKVGTTGLTTVGAGVAGGVLAIEGLMRIAGSVERSGGQNTQLQAIAAIAKAQTVADALHASRQLSTGRQTSYAADTMTFLGHLGITDNGEESLMTNQKFMSMQGLCGRKGFSIALKENFQEDTVKQAQNLVAKLKIGKGVTSHDLKDANTLSLAGLIILNEKMGTFSSNKQSEQRTPKIASTVLTQATRY